MLVFNLNLLRKLEFDLKSNLKRTMVDLKHYFLHFRNDKLLKENKGLSCWEIHVFDPPKTVCFYHKINVSKVKLLQICF